MSVPRVASMLEVMYWPSPAHCAAMLMIAGSTYASGDPSAPPELAGWIRVRITQGELSERMNVTPKTLRKVFAEFAEMDVMRRAEPSRVWYLNPKADDAAGLTRRMMAWKRGELATPAVAAAAGVDGAHWTDPASWPTSAQTLTTPPANGAAPLIPPARPIETLLDPTNTRPKREVRLGTAIANIATDMGMIPADVAEWRASIWPTIDDLISYFLEDEQGKEWESIEEWLGEMRPHIREFVGHD